MLQNGLERKLTLFLSMDSGWYQSYFMHSLNDLTNKIKKGWQKGKKESVTDTIERSCDVECSRNQY